MADRRDKGNGSVYKKDNLWVARYRWTDDATSEKHERTEYAKKEREAKLRLKAIIADVESSDYVQKNTVSVGGWLDTWMEDYKYGKVRSNTILAYENTINVHIKPALGKIELQKLRPDHIQKLMNDMVNVKEKSPATVIKTKNVLNAALKQAIKNRIIAYNPVDAVVPPRSEEKDIRVLTQDEQTRFLAAIKGHRLEGLFKLALATGMRRGELVALKWDCVDLKNQVIHVKSTISRIKDPITGQTSLIENPPKTKKSRRQVPILDSMVPVLQEQRKQDKTERQAAGSAWLDHNLVFPSNVGTHIEPRRINTTLDKILKQAGLEHVNFHALRHTFATRALEKGMNFKVLSEVLGHTDVGLTLNTYSHVVGTTAHDQMAYMNDLFTDRPKKEQPTKEQPTKEPPKKKQTKSKPKGKAPSAPEAVR